VTYFLIFLSGALIYFLSLGLDITLSLMVLLLVMLFLGMPIAFSMGVASLACLLSST